jgi:hypothetical protein
MFVKLTSPEQPIVGLLKILCQEGFETISIGHASKQNRVGWFLTSRLTESLGKGSFFEQKPSKGAQIVQNPAALTHILRQTGQFEMDELKRLDPPFRVFSRRQRDIGLDIRQADRDRLCEQ